MATLKFFLIVSFETLIITYNIHYTDDSRSYTLLVGPTHLHMHCCELVVVGNPPVVLMYSRFALFSISNSINCGRCGLVDKASGSGAEGPGFES